MGKSAIPQWIVRYRNHKTMKLSVNDWIESFVVGTKAARLAANNLSLYWKEVETIPFAQKRKERDRYRNRDRDNDRDERYDDLDY